jgi:hypothetical protein
VGAELEHSGCRVGIARAIYSATTIVAFDLVADGAWRVRRAIESIREVRRGFESSPIPADDAFFAIDWAHLESELRRTGDGKAMTCAWSSCVRRSNTREGEWTRQWSG